jgi:hypothetical protein
MPNNEIRSTLEEIVTLLQKYDRGPADYVLELIRLWPDEPDHFRELALANEVWGGAGSLCDVSLRSIDEDDDAVADDRHLRQAIIRFGEGLESTGQADARVRETTELLRRQDRRNA